MRRQKKQSVEDAYDAVADALGMLGELWVRHPEQDLCALIRQYVRTGTTVGGLQEELKQALDTTERATVLTP